MARLPEGDGNSTSTGTAPTGPSGADVVSEARKFLGDPYVYGAAGPSTFDCSGLVQYVYKQLGISVPRTSEEQYAFGTPVTRNELAAGDLVFTAGSDGTASNPGHVGIYDGAGNVIQAPHTGADVEVTPLSGFDATGYRRVNGLDLGKVAGEVTTAASGVANTDPFGINGAISTLSDKFSALENVASEFYKITTAFFQPSTYVRIGAGVTGALFLVAGVVFIAREAKG